VAFIKPNPGFIPGLPRSLMLPHRLKQHQPSLKHFLDTLPSPFEVIMDDPRMDEGLKEDLMGLLDFSTSKAQEFKKTGNEAFANTNQLDAITNYQHGITVLRQALYKMKNGVDGEKVHTAEKILAVLYANCSAARMMPGEGQDPVRAKQDGEKAIEFDPLYAKG